MAKILIATDHAGFQIKQELIPFIEALGYEVKDFGAHELNPEDDYPDFVIPLAKEISATPGLKGIIIGGSGQGEAMTANRFKGVYAVVYNGKPKPSDGRAVPDEIKIAREHNNSNVLSLGARFLSPIEAKQAVKEWLETNFTCEERHLRRIKKIDEII